MKTPTALFVVLFMALTLSAQTATVPIPNNFFGVVGGLTQNLPQQRATGGITYGHNMGATLWAFTRVEVLGIARNPLQLQTVITEGACDVPHALFNGKLLLGWCLDGGVATAGSNLSSAIGTEGLALYRFGKKQNWGVGLMGGFERTGASGTNPSPGSVNSALTPIRFTVLYGWN